MQKVIDMTGRRLGMLTVIERTEGPSTRNAYWRCRCDCGKEIVVTGSALRRRRHNSCGCFRRENMKLQYIKNDPDWKDRKRTAQKRKPCPYNDGVWCNSKACYRCGWNPKVAQTRMEAKYGN